MRAELVLRWTGLIVWAAVSVEAMLRTDFRQDTLAIRAALLLSFGAAFLWITGLGLAGRRRRTLAALLVWQSLIGTVIFTDLAYIVALTLPFVYTRRTAVLWLVARNVLGLPVLVALVITARHRAEIEISAWSLLAELTPHVAWQLLAFSLGLVITSERRQRAELMRVNAQLHAAHQLLADRARLEERIDIARELHDSIGHHLAALNVQLELARHLAQGAARAPIEHAQATGRRLLGDVREVVSAWRGEAALDLAAALHQLAREIREPEITVDMEPGLVIDDATLARTLLRCAQEAVTNAVRHAGARHVWIELGADDGGLRMAVRDDGCGQATIAEGNGLRGIHERAEALRGHMRASSTPGHGFELELWLPYIEAAA